jgi:transcriptional regulator with XRE-family HTH domain
MVAFCRAGRLASSAASDIPPVVATKKNSSAGGAAVQSPELIGKRVRSIRRRAGVTLEQLAGQTGLNKGYLSRIESGEKSPSIATLLKLGNALNVPVSQLFGEEVDDGDIHIFRGRRTGARKFSRGPAIISLSGITPSANLKAFLIRPSDKFEEEKRAEHSGTEGAFVIEGSVELQFSDRVVALNQGDYVQFPGHLTHQVRRTSPHAMMLIVVSES